VRQLGGEVAPSRRRLCLAARLGASNNLGPPARCLEEEEEQWGAVSWPLESVCGCCALLHLGASCASVTRAPLTVTIGPPNEVAPRTQLPPSGRPALLHHWRPLVWAS